MISTSARLLPAAVLLSILAASGALLAAIEPGARLVNVPPEAVRGQAVSVTVGWDLPAAAGMTPLHVELKDTQANVLLDQSRPVTGSGQATFTFQTPDRADLASIQFAVWLGTDWQNPIGPIQRSHLVNLLTPEQGRARAAELTAWQGAWQAFAAGHPLAGPVDDEAAVLDDPGLSESGHEEAKSASAALAAAGYHLTPITANQLANRLLLTRARFRLLVLTDAGRLPTDAAPAVEAFLRSGGHLIVLGGSAWRDPVSRIHDPATGQTTWMSQTEYRAKTSHVPASHILPAFKTSSITGWLRNTDRFDSTAHYEMQGGILHARVADLEGWDTFQSPADEAAGAIFQPGETLTSFRAKGDVRTPSLAIEWDEKDGSRWIAVAPLTTTWQTYSLPASAFRYWPSTPSRGGPGDSFHPADAARVSIGLAFSHTGPEPGAHEYWVADFGTAANPLSDYASLAEPAMTPADGVFPDYKFFRCSGVTSIRPYPGGPALASDSEAIPAAVYSLQPRPTGSGFDKGRKVRFIPLLEAHGPGGVWRGIPAALMVHMADDYTGGVWASFAIRDAHYYGTPAVRALLTNAAQAMRRGLFLVEAGAEHYTCFPDEKPLTGARVINLGPAPAAGFVEMVVRTAGKAGPILDQQRWPFQLPPGKTAAFSHQWDTAAAGDYTIETQLSFAPNPAGAEVVDQVLSPLTVEGPAPAPDFVTIHDGQFWLDDKPWKANGVNYMPTSGIGLNDVYDFEYWIGASAYDPEIVERDLENIRALGLNAIAVFIHHESINSQNLLDLLRRCRALGLHVNLSLRPGTPMDFEWPLMKDIIQHYRLPGSDTVFAYDLAWEPSLGNHAERKQWDLDWLAWVTDRYGSLTSAEADWGFPMPQEDGKPTNPPDVQLSTDGAWNRMANAYRRFADELVDRHYHDARMLVRSVDPNHAVSFRMSETSDPTNDSPLPYDFAGVAPAVDFLAPEGYGRIGNYERVKPGWFQRAYARWAAPDEPMTWAEVGTSVWDRDTMQDSAPHMEMQGQFLAAFYTMMEQSGSNGVFHWWLPGGFRVGEDSDFGILNPDGSDRPATVAVREGGAAFLKAPTPQTPTTWITFDPFQHATGIYGIYRDHAEEFWKAVAAGGFPGLRTPGTGTTSVTCPAVAVGGTVWNGQNPPAYLDGLVKAGRNAAGPMPPPPASRMAAAPASDLSALSVTLTNIGEAEWVAGKDPAQKGLVWLVGQDTAGQWRQPLPGNVPRMGWVTLRLAIPAGPTQLYLEAAGRGRISSVLRVP